MKRFKIRPWEINEDKEVYEDDINALLELDDIWSKVEEHKSKVEENKRKAKEIAHRGG